jgi:hypothetical protein
MAAYWAVKAKEKIGKERAGNALMLLLVVSMAAYLPQAMKNNACYEIHQKEAGFLKDTGNTMPPDCYVITAQPSLVEIETNRKIIELGFALKNESILNGLIGRECVLFYESSDCSDRTKEKIRAQCGRIKSLYGNAVLAEEHLGNGQYIRIYELSRETSGLYSINAARLKEGETIRFDVPLADNSPAGIKLREDSARITETVKIKACRSITARISKQKNTLKVGFEPEIGCEKKCYFTDGKEAECTARVDLEIAGIGKDYTEIEIYELEKLIRKESIK